MLLPTSAATVWILAIVSLLCLGSWANTLKLAGKWRFEYYYYDFVFGILLTAGLAALLLGSANSQELTFQENLILSGYRKMAWAFASGIVLNLGLLLLLAAMTISGMGVAFPLSLGVALVIGAVWDFAISVQYNGVLTSFGVILLLGGVIVAAVSHMTPLAGSPGFGKSRTANGFAREGKTRQGTGSDSADDFGGSKWNRAWHIP